jgi:hypothetical protein
VGTTRLCGSVITITLTACVPTWHERRAVPTLEPEAGNAIGEFISMKAHCITSLAAALALAVAPVAFGANAPRGSHGQETDRPGGAQISSRCAGSSTTVLVLATRSAAFAAPRGSHGQETDQPLGSQITLRLACISRPAAVLAARATTLKATPPKGSHGQETDQPRAQS